MNNLISLPLEIIVEINRYLTNKDRFECTLVCWHLNSFFHQLLYQSLSFRSRFEFILRSNELVKMSYNYNYIRFLEVNDSGMQNDHFKNFLSKCHNLNKLTIGSHFWGNILMEGFDGEAVFQGFPIMESLATLELDCTEGISIEDIYKLLALCPHLKVLLCKRLLKITLPNELEMVHNAFCPELEEIYLDHQFADESLLNSDFFTQELPEIKNQALSLKKFGVFHGGLWDDFNTLLKYMANKYPLMEELSIKFHPSWQEENGSYSDMIDIPEFIASIDQFVKNCRNIKILDVKDVCWVDRILRQRLQSREFLKHITIDFVLGVSTNLFNLLVLSSFPHVKSLNITLPSVAFFQENYRDLRRCNFLTRLRLSFKWSQLLSINLIIDTSSQLETLELDNVNLDCIHNERNQRPRIIPHHTNLTNLNLTRCNFTNRLWVYIEKKCPNLKQLQIFCCTLCHGKSIILHFPQHCFRSIIINHLRILSPPVNDIKYIEEALEYNTISYKKEVLEFITVRRLHSNHPNPSIARGPAHYVKSDMCQTRSMEKELIESGGPYIQKTQTLKVDRYNYQHNVPGFLQVRHQLQEEQSRDSYTIGYDRSYIPLETIALYHYLSPREIQYFRNNNVDIPNVGDMARLTADLDFVPRNVRFRNPHSKLAICKPTATSLAQELKPHLLVDVYRIMELKINGKWIIC